jgi:hypothetical protein
MGENNALVIFGPPLESESYSNCTMLAQPERVYRLHEITTTFGFSRRAAHPTFSAVQALAATLHKKG